MQYFAFLAKPPYVLIYSYTGLQLYRYDLKHVHDRVVNVFVYRGLQITVDIFIFCAGKTVLLRDSLTASFILVNL